MEGGREREERESRERAERCVKKSISVHTHTRVGQGLDSKPSEGGVKPRGKKSSGQSFHFPPGPGWNDRDPRASIDSQPVVVVENHVS